MLRNFILILFGLLMCFYSKLAGKVTLPYILEQPIEMKSSNEYPLVVCLHGAGGRGIDNQGKGSQAYVILKKVEYRKRYPCFILVPQCPLDQQWVDTSWKLGNYSIDDIPISDELQFVSQLIDSIVTKYPVDKNRIYITGQSMGGFGIWDMILRNPEKYTCAVPICGGGDPSNASVLGNLPIWIFHGSIDPVVPVESSREMYDVIKKVNPNVKYTEYKNVGHNSWIDAWKDEEMIAWMFSKKTKNK